MKINEVRFLDFNRTELRAIRKETGKTGEEELTVGFTQDVADIIGADVAVFIMQGTTAIVKAGE
ncbi:MULTISPECIES: hypothetical protein [Clostridium]|uniref:hypothetical protein n=1 Tax=Clostridium TaxID=1485 RepID=UPI0025894AA4|nr:hypothetical protein [Clostridium sp.]MCI6140434.1 hypothetical protein [Clostridium sp.]